MIEDNWIESVRINCQLDLVPENIPAVETERTIEKRHITIFMTTRAA